MQYSQIILYQIDKNICISFLRYAGILRPFNFSPSSPVRNGKGSPLSLFPASLPFSLPQPRCPTKVCVTIYLIIYI